MVEMLIVMILIALVASVLIPRLFKQDERARVAEAYMIIGNLAGGIWQYLDENANTGQLEDLYALGTRTAGAGHCDPEVAEAIAEDLGVVLKACDEKKPDWEFSLEIEPDAFRICALRRDTKGFENNGDDYILGDWDSNPVRGKQRYKVYFDGSGRFAEDGIYAIPKRS